MASPRISAAQRPSAPAELDLERFAPYRLSILANRVSQAIARGYGPEFGLSTPEWRVIALLGARGPQTAGDLARAAEMDKVAISRAVARLVAAGRIAGRADPDDARRQILSLTPAGARVHASISPAALECERRLLESLDAREREMFDHLLTRLLEAAERL